MEAVLKNKNVLCDIHPNKSGLRLLTESTEIEKYKGNTNAIGILRGPCADFTVQTENVTLCALKPCNVFTEVFNIKTQYPTASLLMLTRSMERLSKGKK